MSVVNNYNKELLLCMLKFSKEVERKEKSDGWMAKKDK